MMSRQKSVGPLSLQSGLTLVELMIALLLSMLLMAGTIQLFAGSKRTYLTSDAMARVQENGRYILELLARDLRQAGYTGCVDDAPVANVLIGGGTSWQFDIGRPVFGYDGSYTGSDPSLVMPTEFDGSGSASGTLEDSDAVAVLFGDAPSGLTVASHNPPSAEFKVNESHDIQSGEILLVTDCSKSALFQVTNANASNKTIAHNEGAGTPGNCTKYLGKTATNSCMPDPGEPYSFANGGFILKLRARSYFIAETSRIDSSGNAIPALYRVSVGDSGVLTTPEELVEGIEDMQILYGVDNDAIDGAPGFGSANKFLRADEVSSAGLWSRVVAIRIELSLRSLANNATQEATTYTYGNGHVAVTDNRLRARFAMTVALRNRTP